MLMFSCFFFIDFELKLNGMFFSISLAIFIFISENNKGASTPPSQHLLVQSQQQKY